jgi:TonB family protein
MDYWAESMLFWSAQILLLVAMLLAAAALLRRSSAAERYRLWLVGLFAIAALPVAGMVIAALPVASPIVESVRYITPAPEHLETMPDRTISPLIQPSAPSETPRQARSFPVAQVLFGGWVAGVLFCMVRPIRSYVVSRRLRAGASIVSEPSLRLLAGYSSQVRAPMLAGILRPMVLLPADISTWAHPEERHAMLLHESAHFERRDHLANLFQTLLGAILFFHPAVRFALRQLLLERELACDEQVLSAGVRPEVYAEALLKVAERSLLAKRECEPAFHTSGSVLERRMTMISNYRDSIAGASRIWRGARLIAVVGMAVLLLPDRALTSGARLAVPMLVAGVPTSAAVQPPLFAEAVGAEPVPVEAVVPVAAGATVMAAQAFRLSGTISDQSGAVVPGVMVRLINPVDGSAQTKITNGSGAYEFFPVSSLQYTFEAQLPGFQTHSRPIRIQSQDLVENAVLVMAAVNTQVEVSISAPQVVPPPSRPAFPVRVGGDIASPNLIFQPKPVFPPGARERGVQGAVRLLGVIGTDGTVTGVYLDPGYPVVDMAFVQAAMESVKQWRYRPAMLNGMPVESITRITVNFSMN